MKCKKFFGNPEKHKMLRRRSVTYKENKPRIGIIGMGFVGGAIAHGFVLTADLKIYDKYNNMYDSLEDTVNHSDFIFVCVPTPMRDDGTQDLSNVYNVVESIDEVAKHRKIIILKSTVTPGTTRKLANTFLGHSFVFNPEFLTARAAKIDFLNQTRIILGGDKESFVLSEVQQMYRTRFTHTPIFRTTWEAAELVKYMCNCFFAVKIAFLNEFYDMAKFADVPYNELRDMFLSDYRIGNSHTDVPGHDGDRGFGGACFPKDINAMITWADEHAYFVDMLEAAELVNNRVRKDKNWEDIKGATSKNNYEA
jgi:UDPglucose 6-dehydrogenase